MTSIYCKHFYKHCEILQGLNFQLSRIMCDNNNKHNSVYKEVLKIEVISTIIKCFTTRCKLSHHLCRLIALKYGASFDTLVAFYYCYFQLLCLLPGTWDNSRRLQFLSIQRYSTTCSQHNYAKKTIKHHIVRKFEISVTPIVD